MTMELSYFWLLYSSALLIGTIVLREMFVWFRNLIPKSVKCWFCQHKTEVPFSLWNNWHCPKCEQYNGFTKDGDYNVSIEQQFEENLNFSVSTLGRCKSSWKPVKSLCRECNRNQQLRVEQLASFVPLNEKNYDVEVEHFKTQIDKAYALCSDCQHLLGNILRKEREDYCVPRRLQASVVTKVTRGTWVLLINALISIFLMIIGFVQTDMASNMNRRFRPFILKTLKTNLPSAYTYVASVSPRFVKSMSALLADYFVLGGSAVSLIAYYRTGQKPVSLLFNALSWLSYLLVSLANESHQMWFPVCQVVLGVISLMISTLELKTVFTEVKEFQQKQQTLLMPKLPKTLKTSFKCTPNGTSTPRSTPPQSFCFVDSTTPSVKNISKAKSTVRDVGLEPGIKGLNLGCHKDDDTHSLWNSQGSITSSTMFLPNSTNWTTSSNGLTMAVNGPANFNSSSLKLANTFHNLSRPTSPYTAPASLITNNRSDYDLRMRKYANSVVSHSSLR